MKKYFFTVELIDKVYTIYASNEEQAIILAQADAIENGLAYTLISISKDEEW